MRDDSCWECGTKNVQMAGHRPGCALAIVGTRGICERCQWDGWNLDGLCMLCRHDPLLTATPATVGLPLKDCVVCGAPTDRAGEFCRRCQDEYIDDLEELNR